MSMPIPDKAEASIDFPDKCFIGRFGRGVDVISPRTSKESTYISVPYAPGGRAAERGEKLLADWPEAAAREVGAVKKGVAPHGRKLA
jgi:hypothetical protein